MVDYQCITLEVANVIGVELNARLTAVDLFGNDSKAREDAVDFVGLDVER